MEMLTVGPSMARGDELVDEIVQTRARLGGPLRVVIMYLPFGEDPSSLVGAIQHALGVPVVGGTTGGVAFTERGHHTDGAVVGLVGGDDVEVHVATARDVTEAGPRAYRKALQALNLGHARRVSVLTFADAFACDGEQIVEALGSLRCPHAKLFGGTVGDGWTFGGTSQVFAPDGVHSDAAVFCAFFTDTPMEVQVLHGFEVAEGAQPLTITAIEGNCLRSLNGMPARQTYGDELKRLGLWDGESDLLQTAALYELGAVTPFGEGLKIRVALALHDDESILLGASLREGESLRVVRASPGQLIQAAGNLSYRVQSKFRKLAGTLVFDCAARWKLLGDQYVEQLQAFRGIQQSPLLGIACYGEIAKSGATIEGFHNTTAVMAGWGDAQARGVVASLVPNFDR